MFIEQYDLILILYYKTLMGMIAGTSSLNNHQITFYSLKSPYSLKHIHLMYPNVYPSIIQTKCGEGRTYIHIFTTVAHWRKNHYCVYNLIHSVTNNSPYIIFATNFDVLFTIMLSTVYLRIIDTTVLTRKRGARIYF